MEGWRRKEVADQGAISVVKRKKRWAKSRPQGRGSQRRNNGYSHTREKLNVERQCTANRSEIEGKS